MLPLPSNHVDIWYWDLSNTERERYVAKAESMMNEVEKQRRTRILRSSANDDFCLSRLFLRSSLSKYSAVQPHEWQFHRNEHGKPAITDPKLEEQLHFNLSHADDCMAVAVSASAPVGVDIENTNRRASLLQIADRFFSEVDVGVLRALSPIEQRRRFFEFWTLREAYVKARGLTLAELYRHLSFQINGPSEIRLHHAVALEDEPNRWHFEILWPRSTHCLAVATVRTAMVRPTITTRIFQQ